MDEILQFVQFLYHIQADEHIFPTTLTIKQDFFRFQKLITWSSNRARMQLAHSPTMKKDMK